jgi:hypothetical protein
MKSILVDIDHTISDAFWRDTMIGVSTWDEYHAASPNDMPLEDMAELLRNLHKIYNIVGFTARPEKFRQITMGWCLKHFIPLDELLMRPSESYEKAPQIKKALIEKRFVESLDEIAFVLEDREDVCAMLKGMNVTVLQVVHGRRK